MDWDEDDLTRRIFDILFPPVENILRAPGSVGERIMQQFRNYSTSLAQIVDEYDAHANVAQRGDEVDAQANVAQIGGHPAIDGAGENWIIYRPGMVRNLILRDPRVVFRRMNPIVVIECRLWLIMLLSSVHRQLSNEQRQTIEGYRAMSYYKILSDNSVHRREIVFINSELERLRNNVPNYVIEDFAVFALELIANYNDEEVDYIPSTEQGFLRVMESLVNLTVLVIYSMFSMIKTLFPSIAQKFFSRPPDRRYQNGHCSPI